MSGGWVFVCGPSGAGKDSVIAAARQIMADHPGVVFARRVVTRAVQPGSDHDPVTESAFQELVWNGGLRWHWHAHGFSYGIAQRYAAEVQAGRWVVVNGSRAHVSDLPPSPQMRVVQISADPEQLAWRLRHRARDSTDAVAKRLARNTRFDGMSADCLIVNDTTLDVAGQQLAHYLTG